MTALLTTPSHHKGAKHNDSYVICANASSHKLQIDENQFCSLGKWKNIELSKGRCEIRNVNGTADINYWASVPAATPSKACMSRTQLQLDDRSYCVSNCMFLG